MDFTKIKESLLKTFERTKRNLTHKQELSEGQKYIRADSSGKRSLKKKKNKNFGNPNVKEPKPRRLIGIGPGFIGYALFFVFALIFSQALISSLSAVLMAFAIVWLLATVVYLLILFGSIDSFIDHEGNDVYKNTETSFAIKLVNHSFLPAPFLEADLRVPEKDSLRCVLKRVKCAIGPSGDYLIDRKVAFGYRGTFDVGVDTVTIYDFLKIFRITVKLYNYRSIYVMPRRFTLNKRPMPAVVDAQNEVQRNKIGAERNDVAEIRQYQPGDQMKNVHWKLSSKSEELMVKNYSMNSGKTVYVFCDMQAHFDSPGNASYTVDINEFGVDGVVELAVAAASREMAEGNSCVLIWHDERAENGIQQYACHDNEEFLNVLKLFSTAPIYREETSVTDLTALVSESQNVTLLFVTDDLDSKFVKGVSRASVLMGGGNGSGVEVYYFDPTSKIVNDDVKEKHGAYIIRCRSALEEQGITVTETTAELSGHTFEQ